MIDFYWLALPSIHLSGCNKYERVLPFQEVCKQDTARKYPDQVRVFYQKDPFRFLYR